MELYQFEQVTENLLAAIGDDGSEFRVGETYELDVLQKHFSAERIERHFRRVGDGPRSLGELASRDELLQEVCEI